MKIITERDNEQSINTIDYANIFHTTVTMLPEQYFNLLGLTSIDDEQYLNYMLLFFLEQDECKGDI